MEIIKTENLTFTYPTENSPAIDGVSLTVRAGEFVTICGKSGCGKTTLLRLLKPTISPHGTKEGKALFEGRELSQLSGKEQTEKIGFVMQNPDNQIVTDKVWHELAFGLESLSTPTEEIRARVAEMASYFGMQDWFYKNISELSGGQKQILNLAGAMVMQPKLLLLDEPTSQLDPTSAQNFLETLHKINREIGITVILTEHHLEEAYAISDRVIVMENGKIIADAPPKEVGELLNESKNDMCDALPTPMRVYLSVPNKESCPLTVREGKEWLEKIDEYTQINKDFHEIQELPSGESAVKLKDIWFRYGKNLPDVIKGLSLEIKKGEFYAIVGGNGTGKTTLLSLISSGLKPYRGKTTLSGRVAMLPQNPQALFTKKTVALDLSEISKNSDEVVNICELKGLLDKHPYDLSGGEQQRAALAKVLLTNPDILLLDEPTKGLDAHFKIKLGEILEKLKSRGMTIIMVSHDVEFCAGFADRCGMFFDGDVVSEDTPRKFFAGKSFYTTAANRMARAIIPEAVLAEDIISACGGKTKLKEKPKDDKPEPPRIKPEEKKSKKLSVKNIVLGVVFAALFLVLYFAPNDRSDAWVDAGVIIVQFICLGISLTNFIPQKELELEVKKSIKFELRTLLSWAVVLIAVPITVYFGNKYFGERRYYFVSLLVILEIMLPFLFAFEKRKPKAGELVLISAVCAITIAGRQAFFMLPQFKPVLALVIICGVCFGGETGFLVGAISAFVSNFFFGQGVWTPWQMFATGLVGFIAAILFRRGILRKTRVMLCMFGAAATLLIYGGILNPASVIMWQAHPTWEMIVSAWLAGIPFDITHAVSTAFFLWTLSVPMTEKLERVKTKYNLMK